MEEPIKIEFSNPDTTPEMLLAAFGGKLENGVWYAPNIKETPVENYWRLIDLTPDKAAFQHNDGEIKYFEIAPEASEEIYEYFKDKIGTRFKMEARLNEPSRLSPFTIDFKGTVINPDKE